MNCRPPESGADRIARDAPAGRNVQGCWSYAGRQVVAFEGLVAFAALKRHQVVMARLLLVVAIAVLSLSTPGCGAPSAPTCEGPERLRFADRSTVPLCDLEMSFSAVGGRPSLSVSGLLPARGPYGVGEELAAFRVTVYRYDRSGESLGTGMIDLLPNRGGIFVGTGGGADWFGDCRLAARKGGLDIDCELGGNAGGALRVTADLSSAPDPHADASLGWLEVTYAFDGAYVAAATVEAVFDAHDDGRIIQVPLADGGLLTVTPQGKEPDGQLASLVLPADSPPGPLPVVPEWRPKVDTPSLGPCTVSLSNEPFRGSISCAGDAESAAGSTRLEASWRVAP